MLTNLWSRLFHFDNAVHDFKELAVSSIITPDFDLDFPKKHVWRFTYNMFDAKFPTVDSMRLDFNEVVKRLGDIVNCPHESMGHTRAVAQDIKDNYKKDFSNPSEFHNHETERKYAFKLYRAIEKDCKKFAVFDKTEDVFLPKNVEKYFDGKGLAGFGSLTCEEKLDYLKRCKWSAYDSNSKNRLVTYELKNNKPLHIKEHDIVRKVESVNDCCKDIMPNLVALGQRITLENPRGIIRLTAWKDGSYAQLMEEKYSAEIMDCIEKDSQSRQATSNLSID